jgi:cytochrome d ubiquinol oxidase subunit II
MEHLLPIVWAGVIAFGVFLYVVLDGFDLGVGILFLSRETQKERDLMMNSIAPFWDGNETWLVVGGAGLMGAFPLAYATLLPAFYLPVMVMLLALVFRGVAFEFRFKAERSRALWDFAFFAGAILTTFCQGVILGGFVQGVKVENGVYAGGPWDWLTPFSLLVGLALLPGYALLGATWLVMKTEGHVQAHARKMSLRLLLAVMAAMGVISLWMVIFDAGVRERWFSFPNILWLAPVPLLAACAAFVLWRSLAKGPDARPFQMAIALFTLGYLGLGVSRWPYVVPPSITIWDAASPPATQGFILVGVAITLPLVLGYTFYVYRVFRGKTGEHYH